MHYAWITLYSRTKEIVEKCFMTNPIQVSKFTKAIVRFTSKSTRSAFIAQNNSTPLVTETNSSLLHFKRIQKKKWRLRVHVDFFLLFWEDLWIKKTFNSTFYSLKTNIMNIQPLFRSATYFPSARSGCN